MAKEDTKVQRENQEQELRMAKILNKAAAVIIVVQLVIMMFMLHSEAKWAKEFQYLEQRYEQLAEDLTGGGL